MKTLFMLMLCALTLSLTAQEQATTIVDTTATLADTVSVDTLDVKTVEKNEKKNKKFENYVRQYKHVSRIDTAKFNALPDFYAKIDYATKWKEKIKGLAMSFKAGAPTSNIDTENLSYAATLGYRAKHFRYELEANYGTRQIAEESYYAGQGLFGLYLDINKMTPTPFKPYIGGVVGAMFVNQDGYQDPNFLTEPNLVYGYRAGLNFRIFCGFYIFGEYYKDFSTIKSIEDELKASNSGVHAGVRLNF